MAVECESMTNDSLTFGKLFSILTPFYALDKCIILIIIIALNLLLFISSKEAYFLFIITYATS